MSFERSGPTEEALIQTNSWLVACDVRQNTRPTYFIFSRFFLKMVILIAK